MYRTYSIDIFQQKLSFNSFTQSHVQGSVEEEGGTLDLIRSSLREQILFYQVSNISVSKGETRVGTRGQCCGSGSGLIRNFLYQNRIVILP
jgi:hypothetical protein